MGLLLALALVLSQPLPLQAADRSPDWTLHDSAGRHWGLNLLVASDATEASGWRLRLHGRSPGLRLDHQRPLRLRDGLGHSWELPNRSAELVSGIGALIPQSSAQFDAIALVPRPSEVIPLQLAIPLEPVDEPAVDGSAIDHPAMDHPAMDHPVMDNVAVNNAAMDSTALVMLPPELVRALHGLPTSPRS
ncbi:MAG: DUF3122 domain-containing protein [Cyanobacteria bacterium]|nr:DUF3122 domain-containing protein [Cyanobacteriota bacterium]